MMSSESIRSSRFEAHALPQPQLFSILNSYFGLVAAACSAVKDTSIFREPHKALTLLHAEHIPYCLLQIAEKHCVYVQLFNNFSDKSISYEDLTSPVILFCLSRRSAKFHASYARAVYRSLQSPDLSLQNVKQLSRPCQQSRTTLLPLTFLCFIPTPIHIPYNSMGNMIRQILQYIQNQLRKSRDQTLRQSI